jgi:hypothetical protein
MSRKDAAMKLNFLSGTKNEQNCRRRYRADTLRTFRGAVMAIRRTGGCMHLTVRTDGRSIRVDLGPEWYMKRCELKVASGDPLEVTGSLVQVDGADVLIANELKKRGRTFVLRNAAGFPEWTRLNAR